MSLYSQEKNNNPESTYRHYRIVLASASPRRLSLLQLTGIEPEVVDPNVDEVLYLPNATPSDVAVYNAELKLKDVISRYNFSSEFLKDVASKTSNPIPYTAIISADTIVVLSDKIFGKPKDDDDAISMLTALSGKTHTVYTGFVVYCPESGDRISEVVSTNVTFQNIDCDIIKKYVQTREPFGKAGSYSIQGIASIFVKAISGSYSNVVGLPIAEVIDVLNKLIGFRPFKLAPL